MRSISSLSAARVSGLMLLVAACAPGVVGTNAYTCDEPALKAALEHGIQLGYASQALCADETCEPAGLSPHVNSPEEGACLIAGLKQGLSDRSVQKHRKHDAGPSGKAQCRADGNVIGQTAAALYCDLSILLGGLGEDALLTPGEESKCSRDFENACTRAFDKAAREHEKRVGDPTQDCRPFTTGEFRRAYEIARFNQCLFSIGEPPPPNDCDDGQCECRDEKSCELECEGDGCTLLCESAERCEATCGDDCDSTCRDVEKCEIESGIGADLLCERADKCKLEPEGGDATCRDVGKCEIKADAGGAILCERAETCDIKCMGPECDVTCRDAGKCEVEIDEGTVHCENSGKCQVKCGKGRRARRQTDGSFVCEDRGRGH